MNDEDETFTILNTASFLLSLLTILYAKLFSVGVRLCHIYTHGKSIQAFIDMDTNRLICTHGHTHTCARTQTADWLWCGGLCQLHANPVFCNPLESCFYSFSTSLCLFLFSSLSFCFPRHQHHHHPPPPMKHSHTRTHTQARRLMWTRPPARLQKVVFISGLLAPECMDSCLSPLPPSLSLSLPVSLSHSSSSCSLPSPQRLSSCWSSLRCSGKSIVCVLECACVCFLSSRCGVHPFSVLLAHNISNTPADRFMDRHTHTQHLMRPHRSLIHVSSQV